jgi:hypothetical protein
MNCGVSMKEAEKKFMYGNEKVEKVAKDSVDEVNRKDRGTGGLGGKRREKGLRCAIWSGLRLRNES